MADKDEIFRKLCNEAKKWTDDFEVPCFSRGIFTVSDDDLASVMETLSTSRMNSLFVDVNSAAEEEGNTESQE